MTKDVANRRAPKCATKNATMLGLALLVGLTVASGGISGWLSNRWGRPADLLTAGKNLERAPSQVGDWILENSTPLSAQVTEVLQCSGSTQRVYRNQKTGDVVTLALIVGPPGPTSVHTPEVCYSSRDFKTISAPERFRAGATGASFWGMTLQATDLHGGKLSVAYAWNDGHGWVAAKQPRFEFGGAKLLYKLQLAASVDRGDPLDQSNPCQTFLKEFLPALDIALFQPPSAENT